MPTQVGLLRDRIEEILDWLAEHPRRPLRRFRGESVTAEGGWVRAELARRDDRLVIWIEPRGRPREAFRLTSQYTIYHAKEIPVDTVDKFQVLSALVHMLERHGLPVDSRETRR